MFYLQKGETRVSLRHLIHLLHCSSPYSKPPLSVHLPIKSSIRKTDRSETNQKVRPTAEVTVQGSFHRKENSGDKTVGILLRPALVTGSVSRKSPRYAFCWTRAAWQKLFSENGHLDNSPCVPPTY